jgi:hypothetical protein
LHLSVESTNDSGGLMDERELDELLNAARAERGYTQTLPSSCGLSSVLETVCRIFVRSIHRGQLPTDHHLIQALRDYTGSEDVAVPYLESSGRVVHPQWCGGVAASSVLELDSPSALEEERPGSFAAF